MVDVLDVLEERDKGAIMLLIWNDVLRSYALREEMEYELGLRGEWCLIYKREVISHPWYHNDAVV